MKAARILGYVMAAAGGVVTLLSSGLIIAIVVSAYPDKKFGWDTIEPTLIFGLPVVAVGIGILVGGVSLIRSG